MQWLQLFYMPVRLTVGNLENASILQCGKKGKIGNEYEMNPSKIMFNL